MSPDRSRRVGGYALIAGAATSWGMWPLILRRAPMDASLQSVIVMSILTLASLPLCLRDRVPARAPRAAWLGIAWLGVADAMNIALFFAAYQRTSVAIAVLTHYLTPVLVALAAPWALGERMTARTWGATLTSLAGLVLLLRPWSAGLSRGDLVGAALGAGSAVFYASNVIVTKKLSRAFSGSEQMFFHGLVAVPLLWLLVPSGALASAPRASLVVIALAALGPGALGGLTFVWGLRRVPAGHASVLTLLEPLVAVLLAAVWLGEIPPVVSVFGGAAVLAGAVVVVTGRTTSSAPA
ncbi:MAG: DMT family transporter [Polyangiaceae bacterium]